MIPAGVEDGQTLRLRGEGNAGEAGDPPGDLYVMVNVVPHRVYARRDSDIYLEVMVIFVLAMLCTDITNTTLYGDVKLSVPHGTQPGAVFKVKGRGLPNYGGWGKGDQYVKVTVEIPKSLSDQQKELLKRFGESR